MSIKIVLFMGLSFLVLLACKSNLAKENKAEIEHHLIVELKDGLNKKYLNDYNGFKLFDVKQSNRTLNQYSAKLLATLSELEKLISIMKSDANVIAVSHQKEHSDRMNSTNTKKTKTSPIKNK